MSHDYGRVDYKSIWKTFEVDIPVLQKSLENLLKEEFGEEYLK
ncbi:hypothetical protein [Veillonella criceti]